MNNRDKTNGWTRRAQSCGVEVEICFFAPGYPNRYSDKRAAQIAATDIHLAARGSKLTEHTPAADVHLAARVGFKRKPHITAITNV